MWWWAGSERRGAVVFLLFYCFSKQLSSDHMCSFFNSLCLDPKVRQMILNHPHAWSILAFRTNATWSEGFSGWGFHFFQCRLKQQDAAEMKTRLCLVKSRTQTRLFIPDTEEKAVNCFFWRKTSPVICRYDDCVQNPTLLAQTKKQK